MSEFRTGSMPRTTRNLRQRTRLHRSASEASEVLRYIGRSRAQRVYALVASAMHPGPAMAGSSSSVRAWLAGYDRPAFRADLVAGVTLAAYVLPAAIGDASLAGVPAQAGLYACLFGGLVFWIFCSSRVTTVSVTSAISLLVGATLATLAPNDPARHAALATCTALI